MLICLIAVPAARAAAGNGMLAYEANGRPQDGYGDTRAKIYALNPDGTGLSPITSRDAYYSLDTDPEFSPDGNQLVYTQCPALGTCNDDHELYVANSDGSNARHLTTGYGAAWSPDASKLVFIGSYAWPSDGFLVDALYVINADATGLHLLFSPTGCRVERPVWSPDGTTIFYFDACNVPSDGEQGWYAVKADGTGRHEVFSSYDLRCHSDTGYNFAPDSTRVVISCTDIADAPPSGYAQIDLYYMRLSDGSLSQITHTPAPNGETAAQEYYPVVSPDGSRIAYFSGDNVLYTIAADGSDATPVPGAPPLAAGNLPAWQPCIAGVTVSCAPPPPPAGGGDPGVPGVPGGPGSGGYPGSPGYGSGTGYPGSGSSGGSRGGAGTHPGGVSVPVRTMSLTSRGTVELTLACGKAQRCQGHYQLTVPNAANGRPGQRPKTLVLAFGRYSMPAGKSSKLTIRLSAKALNLLRSHHGHLTATLTITPAHGKASRRTVKLTLPAGNPSLLAGAGSR